MSKPRIHIREAETSADAHQLLHLIECLADFEKLEAPDAAARERFIHDGFERIPRRFQSILARVEGDDAPCGYAIVFETYSTFLCRPTLYLEDLFVLPERRKHGAGLAILKYLASEAMRRGCGRMEWACLDWNKNAQQFYERTGAEHLSEWLFYRFDREALARFAGGD